jgi:exosortase
MREKRVINCRIRHRHALRISGKHNVQGNFLRLVSVALLLLAATVWSHWLTIVNLSRGWRQDDYSAGQLVPIIALFLLWRERRTLRDYSFVPCWWGGIALLLLAEAARVYGYLSALASLERGSLVLMVAGLVLLVAGWQVLRRVLWILLFLFLMIPLPGRVHNLISGPLQTVATTGSVFVLEAFGATVSQQGNVVMLNETIPMAVAEACSGLRMLTAFVIVAAFVAYMVKRSRPQKAVLLLSSIPVAVACNIVRICATGALILLVGAEVGQKFFHDFAGLAMMPVAALLLFAELWLMDKLIVPEPGSQQEQARGRSKTAAEAGAKRGKRLKSGAG